MFNADVPETGTTNGDNGGSYSCRQGIIPRAFNPLVQDKLASKWAKVFYTIGQPLNLANSLVFMEVVKEISKRVCIAYRLPTSKLLRHGLLDKEKTKLKVQVTNSIIESTNCGFSISCDGWSNICKEPIMNIMLFSTKGDYISDNWSTH